MDPDLARRCRGRRNGWRGGGELSGASARGEILNGYGPGVEKWKVVQWWALWMSFGRID